MNKPNLRIPSARRALVQLHRDLFSVDYCIIPHSPAPLTRFEEMVLSSEDHRFFSHIGIDFVGVGRELTRALSGRSVRGASTIEMQFVRTATGNFDRTLKRKLREAVLSVLLQFRYSKVQILRSYMNIAFFGSGLTERIKLPTPYFSRPPNLLRTRKPRS